MSLDGDRAKPGMFWQGNRRRKRQSPEDSLRGGLEVKLPFWKCHIWMGAEELDPSATRRRKDGNNWYFQEDFYFFMATSIILHPPDLQNFDQGIETSGAWPFCHSLFSCSWSAGPLYCPFSACLKPTLDTQLTKSDCQSDFITWSAYHSALLNIFLLL